ncbi:septum formation protein Maf [Rhodovarius crocodyli]|uniref:Nucleoside triphosphate pyrophosphatase n=1 Tax=Rhodovarius crocodyli TaxID=1979269 RepID=A0A437MP86_9PROT|nr:Maf family protein [Rhodovarius crocodyli]RVT99452.1 septum formation protein Maf [Rhodovarius crocodyli]
MPQAEFPPLVLASQSSARRGLLAAAGLRFTAEAAHVDEDALKAAARAEEYSPEDAAVLLADAKAERISRRRPEALVLGADQILECEGSWFDKPADMAGAAAHLRALSGKRHRLVNGIVAFRGGSRIWTHLDSPKLWVRPLSETFIEEYLALEGEAVLSSVGAYRLEGPGIQLFDRIEGEHSSILGLPMLAVLGFLRQQGVLPA